MRRLPAALLAALLALTLLTGAAGADETRIPDGFSFSGGSGRVTITCPRVRITDGGTFATVVFSSPRYESVRVGDTVYTTVTDAETSSAEIPAELNRPFEIRATTTAMSVPHEIRYTLYIRCGAAGEGPLPGIEWRSSLPLRYAEGFRADFYEGGYALIDIRDGDRLLVVPEGMPVPEGIDPGLIVVRQPLTRVYLAATSAASLIGALDALGSVRFSSLQQGDWTVESAAQAMERGEMVFAGKYDAPDFELLVKEDCDLALESTMIFHAPQIRELLELLNIPVAVDRSSYESHPLGRAEWIKFYGVLFGRTEAAQALFDEKAAEVEALPEAGSAGRTVAFFHFSANGSVIVRGPSDYITRMIEMGGGENAFAGLSFASDAGASVTIGAEDFYDAAQDADLLIYNTAIGEAPRSVAELTERFPLLADFRAVREGNVWLADRSLYQATFDACELTVDVNRLLNGEEDGFVFLRRLPE